MDTPTEMDRQDTPPAYKTSKQVQAWFLGRSRALWKKKYAELKVESRRLQQRVADVCRSRADWRGKAEAALREAEQLRVQLAELQARLDRLPEEAQKKIRSSRPG
jgi:DNA repair exonuclease SbcCD ATPase subunit